MSQALLIINIVISLLIILCITIQGGGAGLGSAWGGGGETFQTRRGIEKWTLRFTFILILLFFLISVVKLLI